MTELITLINRDSAKSKLKPAVNVPRKNWRKKLILIISNVDIKLDLSRDWFCSFIYTIVFKSLLQ